MILWNTTGSVKQQSRQDGAAQGDRAAISGWDEMAGDKEVDHGEGADGVQLPIHRHCSFS